LRRSEIIRENISGAIPVRDLIALIKAAGFEHVELVGTTGVATCAATIGATFRARGSVPVKRHRTFDRTC